MIAGAGDDTVTASNGSNIILGDEGEARLFTDGTVDEIRSTNPGVGGTDSITLGDGTNVVIAGSGNDSVSVGAGTATILGDEGQSVVTRDSGTSAVTGRVVETTNDAVGGDDEISATGAVSIVMGGAGSDTVTGTNPGGAIPPQFIVLGDAGRAQFDATSQLRDIFTKTPNTGAADIIRLENADDVVFGGDAGDTIDTAAGANIVVGYHGHATFDANGQLKTIYSIDTTTGGDDTIHTGQGNDLVLGGAASDTITADGGNNVVVGDNAQVTFNAAGQIVDVTTTDTTTGGDDTIHTGQGNDLVLGGAASDTITADDGNNVVVGDNGNVVFDRDTGIITVQSIDCADGGDDSITTGNGYDLAIGGSGSDSITLGDGHNVLVGDNGYARVSSSADFLTVQATCAGDGGADSLSAGTGNDLYIGGQDADTFHDAGGSNVFIGDFGDTRFDDSGTPIVIVTTHPNYGGNDVIYGGPGNDIIFGGAGSDVIHGGDGSDILLGDHGLFDSSLPRNQQFLSIDTDSNSGAGND